MYFKGILKNIETAKKGINKRTALFFTNDMKEIFFLIENVKSIPDNAINIGIWKV